LPRVRLDPNDPDVRTAAFGQQVQNFMNSDIGQYIEERANAEIMEALAKLRTVDAADANKIRELQMQVAIPERILVWMQEAIQQGNQAFQAILEEAPQT